MAAQSLTKASSFLLSSTKSNVLKFTQSSSSKPFSSSNYLPPLASLSISHPLGISQTFSKLKEQGKVALIPYITAGDPDLSVTSKALQVLDSCGADIIELGIPFSDPLLDGPVIQAAMTRSLRNGTNFDKIMTMLSEVVPLLSSPITVFSYYNPILRCGVQKFMASIKEAGVHGLLVPDIPLEETDILRKEAVAHNIELVLITTPTTPLDRMRNIVEASEGFVYLVSSIGVSGVRSSINGQVKLLLQEIKEVSTKPVAVGFGISSCQQVKQVARWGADGVIVGSAMVKILGEEGSTKERLKKLELFTKSLKNVL